MKHTRDGFTMLEILALLVVLGIMLAIATPSYVRYINTMRMRESTQQVARDLERARTEAKRTNTCWTFKRISSTQYRLQSYVNSTNAALPSRECTGTAGTVINRTMGPGTALNLVTTADTAYFRPPFGTNYGASEKLSFQIVSTANTSIRSTVTVLGVLAKVIIK